MTALTEEREIRTAACPNCRVCGSGGAYLYQNQRDRLFGAPGAWSLRQCSDPSCALLWLDPMPLTEDLGKAYLNYYTHRASAGSAHSGGLKRFYHKMKRAYWAGQYGYPSDLDGGAVRVLGALLRFFPIRRGDVDAEVRFLPALPQGELLDVGCGTGEWLQFMRGLGWRTRGVDFDEKAVALARKEALDVRAGSLEQQEFPSGAFDAVTLNHVIEHVPDPIGTLGECARILKPGGKIVVATPNSASRGHRYFKENWRGLEPPRHLHIFSPASLRQAMTRAGFRQWTIHQQIAQSVTYQSALLCRRSEGRPGGLLRALPPAAVARLFSLWEWLLPSSDSAGDCMTAVAIKE